MSKIKWTLLIAPIAALIVVMMWRDEAPALTDPTTAIEELENRFAAAVQAKDLDGIMANYTNSDNLVVFDVMPPRQYTGWQAYKDDWKNALAGCKDAPKVEISELEIVGDTRYAYSHCIQHFTCTDPQGKKSDLILRVTDGYANFRGKWLIAHEHISVPVDLATGKADLQSKSPSE
ncbi:MAG TPA: nuclear transport factor 2 family protein [Candidatus Binataceae bacterium]|nr:nuclear transport factor 2 family protein [Candidatus Binataceae bacterium]